MTTIFQKTVLKSLNLTGEAFFKATGNAITEAKSVLWEEGKTFVAEYLPNTDEWYIRIA